MCKGVSKQTSDPKKWTAPAPGFEIPGSATVMVPKATRARATNILFHTGVNLRIE